MSEAVAREEIKKLEKQGIFAHDPASWYDSKDKSIAVRVDTALPEGADVKALEWNIDVVNKRGCTITLSDFKVEDIPGGQRIFSFVASMRVPENVGLPFASFFATSFADLCWFQGNEAVTRHHEPEALTQVRKTATCDGYNDLGWYLPCRFADRLIDALGKANDFLMSGTLEDAMLYGVMTKAGS